MFNEKLFLWKEAVVKFLAKVEVWPGKMVEGKIKKMPAAAAAKGMLNKT
jgi:hypothetical protein